MRAPTQHQHQQHEYDTRAHAYYELSATEALQASNLYQVRSQTKRRAATARFRLQSSALLDELTAADARPPGRHRPDRMLPVPAATAHGHRDRATWRGPGAS